jgi:hypothetical protein
MLKIVDEDTFCCPYCGDEWVHLDQAGFATRTHEDGPITNIVINPGGGMWMAADGDEHRHAKNDPANEIPMGTRVGVGRRHRIVLYGWCETCPDTFALVFTQHKGRTLFEVVKLEKDFRGDD